MTHVEKPLAGVKVLDLTQAYSGPFATMHLADHGAQVIKVEIPGNGDQTKDWSPLRNGASGYFGYINRNKRGIALNLKSDEGKEVFKDLVREVDVVCENFRVGTMEKLGLDYEVLRAVNPGLIYASISGFGLEGSMAKLPCYDVVAQAEGGMISMTGFPGQPVKVGPAIADNYSGTYLALGITMALYQKQKTGMGRRLDVSMVDTIFSILESGVVEYTVNGKMVGPFGNRDPSIAPFDSFPTKDGEFVMACGTDKFWKRLCEVMKKPELVEDERYNSNAQRLVNYAELKKEIVSWSERFMVREVEEQIVRAGIPFGRIKNMQQVCESELIKSRNMLWTVHDHGIGEDILIPGTPIKFHGSEDEARFSAPVLGENTKEILIDLVGYSEKKIKQLQKDAVI